MTALWLLPLSLFLLGCASKEAVQIADSFYDTASASKWVILSGLATDDLAMNWDMDEKWDSVVTNVQTDKEHFIMKKCRHMFSKIECLCKFMRLDGLRNCHAAEFAAAGAQNNAYNEEQEAPAAAHVAGQNQLAEMQNQLDHEKTDLFKEVNEIQQDLAEIKQEEALLGSFAAKAEDEGDFAEVDEDEEDLVDEDDDDDDDDDDDGDEEDEDEQEEQDEGIFAAANPQKLIKTMDVQIQSQNELIEQQSKLINELEEDRKAAAEQVDYNRYDNDDEEENDWDDDDEEEWDDDDEEEWDEDDEDDDDFDYREEELLGNEEEEWDEAEQWDDDDDEVYEDEAYDEAYDEEQQEWDDNGYDQEEEEEWDQEGDDSDVDEFAEEDYDSLYNVNGDEVDEYNEFDDDNEDDDDDDDYYNAEEEEDEGFEDDDDDEEELEEEEAEAIIADTFWGLEIYSVSFFVLCCLCVCCWVHRTKCCGFWAAPRKQKEFGYKRYEQYGQYDQSASLKRFGNADNDDDDDDHHDQHDHDVEMGVDENDSDDAEEDKALHR